MINDLVGLRADAYRWRERLKADSSIEPESRRMLQGALHVPAATPRAG
jgi:hypothetical protein